MVFRKPKDLPADLIRIDNCVIKQASACDYLLLDWLERKHFVELKGRHVEDGLKQIEATIPHFVPSGSDEPIWCFVVCTKYPRLALPGSQKQQALIRKKWNNARIVVKTSPCEHVLTEETKR